LILAVAAGRRNSADRAGSDLGFHRPEASTIPTTASAVAIVMAWGDAGGWGSAGLQALACARRLKAARWPRPARRGSSPHAQPQQTKQCVIRTSPWVSRRLALPRRRTLDRWPTPAPYRAAELARTHRLGHTDTRMWPSHSSLSGKNVTFRRDLGMALDMLPSTLRLSPTRI